MKRLSMLIFTLTAAVGLVGAAGAQELTGTLKKIKDSSSITIGHRDASIPFSYYDDKQQPVGYAMDLCMRIVDAVKTELKMQKLDVKYQLVTSANRIPLMANGTIDLECGSTTNNIARQKEVSFTITHFLTANRVVSKKSANLKSEADLKGKTMVSTSGTTNIKQLTDVNTSKNMGMNIIPANGHPEAFQMVETGRAVGFAMDDILLYSLVASSRNPSEFVISDWALSLPEPYGIMLRKDDAPFKKIADNAMTRLYKSGEAAKIYDKWFLKPVPPKGINLNVPLSPQMKNLFANPTDSGDPAAYK
jgi:glutamate/aspartate transport system substrate-binding protein